MQYNQEINQLRIRLNRFRTIVPVLICALHSSIILIIFGANIPDYIIFLSILTIALVIIQTNKLLSRIFSREIELLTSELLSAGLSDSSDETNNPSDISNKPSNYSNKQHLRIRGSDQKGPAFGDKTSNFSTAKSRIDAFENKQYDDIESIITETEAMVGMADKQYAKDAAKQWTDSENTDPDLIEAGVDNLGELIKTGWFDKNSKDGAVSDLYKED